MHKSDDIKPSSDGICNNSQIDTSFHKLSDTLILSDVYLDARLNIGNDIIYSEPDQPKGFEYLSFQFSGDTVYYSPYKYINYSDSVVYKYILPKSNKAIISQLAIQAVSGKVDPYDKSEWTPRKLDGFVNFYTENIPKSYKTSSLTPSNAVDSLYRVLLNLPDELAKLKPIELYYNRYVKVINQHSIGILKSGSPNSSLEIWLGNDRIVINNEEIVYYNYGYRERARSEISKNNKEFIFNLFTNTKIIEYNNTVNFSRTVESLKSYSILLDGHVLFFYLFPSYRTLNLSTKLSIKEQYIFKIYKVWEIAKKYFPDYLSNYRFNRNGNTINYQ